MCDEVQHGIAATALDSNGSGRRAGRGLVGSSGALFGALDACLDPDEVRAVWRADGPDDTTDLGWG